MDPDPHPAAPPPTGATDRDDALHPEVCHPCMCRERNSEGYVRSSVRYDHDHLQLIWYVLHLGCRRVLSSMTWAAIARCYEDAFQLGHIIEFQPRHAQCQQHMLILQHAADRFLSEILLETKVCGSCFTVPPHSYESVE